jgi:hypothetical protein
MGRIRTSVAALAAVMLFGVVGGSAAVPASKPKPKKAVVSMIETTTALHFPPGLPVGGTAVITTVGTSQGRQVADSVFSCVVVKTNLGLCHASTRTKQGQIESQGRIDLNAPFGTIAIVGGTGAYKQATGYITRTKITQTKVTETFHFFFH